MHVQVKYDLAAARFTELLKDDSFRIERFCCRQGDGLRRPCHIRQIICRNIENPSRRRLWYNQRVSR